LATGTITTWTESTPFCLPPVQSQHGHRLHCSVGHRYNHNMDRLHRSVCHRYNHNMDRDYTACDYSWFSPVALCKHRNNSINYATPLRSTSFSNWLSTVSQSLIVICLPTMPLKQSDTESNNKCKERMKEFNVHGSGPPESRSIIVQQVATIYSLLYFCKLLYMFRLVTPPIIRSTYNCNYSIWQWSKFGNCSV
jgi:hypothetical protein